ncbi:MAG: hypothetical protein KDA53_00655 [Hyphomonas sp.]|nr:hypothetical protein [Hyphomonas sp.]
MLLTRGMIAAGISVLLGFSAWADTVVDGGMSYQERCDTPVDPQSKSTCLRNHKNSDLCEIVYEVLRSQRQNACDFLQAEKRAERAEKRAEEAERQSDTYDSFRRNLPAKYRNDPSAFSTAYQNLSDKLNVANSKTSRLEAENKSLAQQVTSLERSGENDKTAIITEWKSLNDQLQLDLNSANDKAEQAAADLQKRSDELSTARSDADKYRKEAAAARKSADRASSRAARAEDEQARLLSEIEQLRRNLANEPPPALRQPDAMEPEVFSEPEFDAPDLFAQTPQAEERDVAAISDDWGAVVDAPSGDFTEEFAQAPAVLAPWSLPGGWLADYEAADQVRRVQYDPALLGTADLPGLNDCKGFASSFMKPRTRWSDFSLAGAEETWVAFWIRDGGAVFLCSLDVAGQSSDVTIFSETLPLDGFSGVLVRREIPVQN